MSTSTPEFGFPLPANTATIAQFPWHLRNLSTTLEEKIPAAITADVRRQLPAAVDTYAGRLESVVAEAKAITADYGSRIPIFETLAEAEEWEAKNPGRTALTTEDLTGPITPPAPTADDKANTYTIPSRTGVEYLVGGVVKPAGTYIVGNVDTTVTVTARATGERPLTGDTVWPLFFTRMPGFKTVAYSTFDEDQVPLSSYPAGAGTLVPRNADAAPSVSGGSMRHPTSANTTVSATLATPVAEPGIQSVRLSGSYTLGKSPSPNRGTLTFGWTALFNGSPSTSVMSVSMTRLYSGGSASFSGASTRVSLTTAHMDTIPAEGQFEVTIGQTYAEIKIDGQLAAEFTIGSAYKLNPEQSPFVTFNNEAAVSDLRIEVGS